jgi:hypothetical protein
MAEYSRQKNSYEGQNIEWPQAAAEQQISYADYVAKPLALHL